MATNWGRQLANWQKWGLTLLTLTLRFSCLFEKWPQPPGLGAIAMASNLWNSSGVCGACISINGPSGEAHQGIVSDQCPSCKEYSLDLAPDLWSLVSNNKTPGVLNISWEFVSCNFSTPIQFINKDGVSNSSTSVQVDGSNTPISSLEVLPTAHDSKEWIKLIRQASSNFFQPEDNAGLGSIGDLRITCGDGKTIVTNEVNLDQPFGITNATGNC
ncbi:hypothetical protein VP01_1532g7 [Puccinia sorghi]|uniref:Expansin-like EG45 domain-containing protein n=1 Tax=Puccinia sorghi TaxID=27349 RepID=A0A0L6VIJ7_9BASI|nr:hypothetical protein VP01_1532g7 [Puccinia sorghi]